MMMQALTSTNLVSAKTVRVAAKKRGLVVMNNSSGPKRVRRERRARANETRMRTRGSKPESLGDLLNRDSSWEGRFRVRGSEGNSTETRTRWTARRRRRRRTSGMNAGKCFRGDTAARERRRGRRGTRERSIARLGLGRGVSRSDDPRSDPRGSDGRAEATTMRDYDERERGD